jgi:cytochrome c-type biogenesis protein CcmH/NrfG
MKTSDTKSIRFLSIFFGLLAPIMLTQGGCAKQGQLTPVGFVQNIPIPEERFSDPPRPSAEARANAEKLKLAVATNPGSADTWTNFGWRLYKDGRYGECEWVMSEARKRSPNDPYILWLSGVASYAMGHYSDAKQYLWQMWKDNKTWPDTVDMGVTYDVLGRIALLQPGLFETPLFIAAYFLSKAADEEPKNWQVHFILGVTEWYRQRYGEALDALEKARSLNPNNPVVLRYYAWARVAVDERHWKYAKEAVEQERWPEAAKDEREAIKAYKADIAVIKKAITADPTNAENYELLGRYYWSLGQTGEAETALRKAVALDEKDASARYFLAKILLSFGTEATKKEAKQLLIRSIALAPMYWERSTDAPHVGLLITILIQDGQLLQAQALTDWLVEQDAEDK